MWNEPFLCVLDLHKKSLQEWGVCVLKFVGACMMYLQPVNLRFQEIYIVKWSSNVLYCSNNLIYQEYWLNCTTVFFFKCFLCCVLTHVWDVVMFLFTVWFLHKCMTGYFVSLITHMWEMCILLTGIWFVSS
jgi:hypothetical protein